MGLTLVTDAASLAVTLAEIAPEVESYEQSVDNDAVLTKKLYEAIDYFQNQTQRQLIQATYKQTLNSWPFPNSDGYYAAPVDVVPLYSVSSVKYYDTNGTLQTVSSSDYFAITTAPRPCVAFNASSFTFPSLQLYRPEAIEITFVAGYANAAAVPYMAKVAIKMLATYWYEQRPAVVTASAAAPTATTPALGEIPYGVTQIINMLRADGYT